jgi:hypothetical protein
MGKGLMSGPPIARQPGLANTPSGKDRRQSYEKSEGARLVAKVMTRAETEQKHETGGHGVIFTIEDGNHAKRINMDAPPK